MFALLLLVSRTLLESRHSESRFKVGLSRLRNIFAKLKFSPALFEKIPSFVYLVFKIENK